MSEQPAQQSGLNRSFDLGERLIHDKPKPEEFENEAMAAARRLYEDMNTDPKTGLLKQESWLADLSRDIESISSPEHIAGIIVYVTDVNEFKSANDKLGHAEGDKLIGIGGRAYSDTFRRDSDRSTHGSRDSDNPHKVAHLGGDEYAAHTLRKANPASDEQRQQPLDEEARVQIERLNARFQELLVGTHFANLGLKFSTGYAIYEPGDTSESLFAKADMNMFANKYQGKIDAITDEDKERLTIIVPFLEGLGARVDPWIKLAIAAPKTAA